MRTKPDQQNRRGRKTLRRSADGGVSSSVPAGIAEHFALGVRRRPIRNTLAAAATCALLAGGTLSLGATSALASQPGRSTAALGAALGGDLNRYLTDRRTAEHISAVSLRVTFAGSRPPISLATGTTRYGGGPPVAAGALWHIGSNTKAFTSVILFSSKPKASCPSATRSAGGCRSTRPGATSQSANCST